MNDWKKAGSRSRKQVQKEQEADVEGLASGRPENNQRMTGALLFCSQLQFERLFRRARRHGSKSGGTPDATLARISTSEFGFKFATLLTFGGFLFFNNPARAQSHAHLNIGAVGTNQNDALTFDNGGDFATAGDYVKTLTFTNAGKYSGYYAGNITLTVLAATGGFGGPVANAPALGSHIKAQIVSVDGPPGGAFGFWDTTSTNAPTFSILSGATGTNTFDVSQTDGSPGVDPFGHIHGRQFTATKPGIYVVGFKAFDVSTNGAGGGPIHNESEILKIYFQAGINIASLEKTETGTAVRFGTLLDRTFFLEASDDLSTTNWTAIDSVFGDDHFQNLTDGNQMPSRFYRIRVGNP